MLGRLYEGQECSAAWTLELVGERWSLLILRDALFAGSTRFSQFQKSLGIATNVLTKRLEGFVDAGLMDRRQDGSDQEYIVTAKAVELKSVIMALTQWGDKWIKPGPFVFADATDGQSVELRPLRAGDDAPIDYSDVVSRRRGQALG